MKPLDLTNKRVTIIGAKRSGIAVANLISELKGRPRISENGSLESNKKDLEKLNDQKIPMEWNGHTQKFIEESDLIILSPGVRIDAPPVLWAKAKGISVWGEIELAFRLCQKPIIAVTGSNGKTTTVNLIAEILKAAGKKACLCGNVGTPFSSQVLNLKDVDFVVLEVSSFQMESIEQFRPFIAVLLNFSQNHLDRHKDLQEYLDAKKRIFLNQTKDDYLVLNAQDQHLKDLGLEAKSKAVFFNTDSQQKITRNPNFLAALTVGQLLDVKQEICLEVFRNFKGVEHRLELVRAIEGVQFINDSKATTTEAGRWAMSYFDQPIVMICGGRDKNIDYTVLRELVQKKVKKMIVIGEAKEKIKRAFNDVVAVEECGTLKEAVVRAQKSAVSGESVVFSPMCTSFDMFANFEERGKIFKEIVKEL